MKPWISWTLFFTATAAIALFSSSQWATRIIVFFILTIPTTLWAQRQIKKAENRSR